MNEKIEKYYDRFKKFAMAKIFNNNEDKLMIFLIFLLIIIFLLYALIIKWVWNIFVSPVFNLTIIDFKQASAIVIIIQILHNINPIKIIKKGK